MLIAFITTAVFALQLVVLDRLRADMWGAIWEGLAIVFAFLAAKQAGAFTCDLWHINGHHDHCASVTALCVFGVLIMYFPFGLHEMWRSAWFCFCLLGLPADMLWFGKRKHTTHSSTADPSTPNLQTEELKVDSGDVALVSCLRYDPDAWGISPMHNGGRTYTSVPSTSRARKILGDVVRDFLLDHVWDSGCE